MKNEGEKKDILAEILSGSEEDVIEGLEELCKIINLDAIFSDGSKSPKKDSIPAKKATRKPTRKQASHYLTEKVLQELGETKSELRELFPSIPKSKVTKSRIVDLALRTILEEYKEKGAESELIRKLTTKITGS
ncbi:MAG TPA: hypothetical protein HPP59_01250 [Deltaproteobacteria bacterium]|nr:hypothetical protein [Deltaproteobacteria bacterium]HIJ40331.1 hypothetical protein [Deltaproteobacteria bacterium]